jgi:carboxyl-terminal processing protease
MRKSESTVWTLLLLALLIAGSTIVSLARNGINSATTSDLYRQFQLFGEVLEYVRFDCVENQMTPS